MFSDGSAYERIFSTSLGPIEVYGEVEVRDGVLMLTEFSVFPTKTGSRLAVGVGTMRQIFRAVESDARAEGVQYLHHQSKAYLWGGSGAYDQSNEEAVMTPDTTQLDLEVTQDALRRSIAAGASREELIEQMRANGLSQLGCIKMLRDLLGIPFGDAKEIVHFSAAWSDLRARTEALHEAAFTAAEELGYRPVGSEA